MSANLGDTDKLHKNYAKITSAICWGLFMLSDQSNHSATPMTVIHSNIYNPAPTINQLLCIVAEGEQDKAEEILKKYPHLLLESGDVQDLSQNFFKKITPLQYAIWALDWNMWMMILKYLPYEEAKAQAKLFETGDWVMDNGVTVSWQPLIDALQKYNDHFETWSFAQRDHHWIHTIGELQLKLPAHAINEICRPDRSFYITPDFEKLGLPRTRQTDKGEWFSATYDGGRLGEKWAVVRGAWDEARASGAPKFNSTFIFTFRAADLNPMKKLLEVRTRQREQLIHLLKNEATIQHSYMRSRV